jgi:hypothetical protein
MTIAAGGRTNTDGRSGEELARSEVEQIVEPAMRIITKSAVQLGLPG